ncbi:MAG: glycyl-radical enzyme activating protein [Peptococcaceae bacterium]|nr:glycyl-radical enzyme activating protein [Peptococcaceae bacterium]
MSSLITNIQGYSIHDGPGIRTVVFLKGCGLNCLWCSNPECISPYPEIGFIKTLCTKCGQCATVCPNEAISAKPGQLPVTNRERCSGCGACSAVCVQEARVLYGKPMSVDEVFEAVKGDQLFYQASGGGITVSGGEPLLQPRFVSELLRKCKQADIHTCIETSGYGSESALRQVMPYTDYILFDLKHLSSALHRRYTGKPNELILNNAKIVISSGLEVLFRMPLIPGINDDPQNIRATADFLYSLGKKPIAIQLMLYHQLGKGKYESLDKPYPLAGLSALEPEQAETVQEMFKARGIDCTISR